MLLPRRRQLRREIALQAARLQADRHTLALQSFAVRDTFHRTATAPRTLALSFAAGLAYGLIGDKHIVPSGLRWIFWQGGSTLLTSLLARTTLAMTDSIGGGD